MSASNRPAADKPKKTSKTSWYATIAGLALGVVFMVKGISSMIDGYHELFGGHELAACDGSGVADTLKDIARQKHVDLTSIGDLKSISHTKSVANCTADIVASDHSKARISYRIDFDGKKNVIRILGAKPL